MSPWSIVRISAPGMMRGGSFMSLLILRARLAPLKVSWSVIAIESRRFFFASFISCSGVIEPSLAVV